MESWVSGCVSYSVHHYFDPLQIQTTQTKSIDAVNDCFCSGILVYDFCRYLVHRGSLGVWCQRLDSRFFQLSIFASVDCCDHRGALVLLLLHTSKTQEETITTIYFRNFRSDTLRFECSP